jgi:hypothetical protein
MTLIRRHWFALTSGFFCFAWALLGWLTTIPNQDILADGIQVQTVLADPRVVLAFPGQKHGGPLEYPFSIAAEWLAPGNFYANGAVRPLLAFLTGFLVAKLFLELFAKAPKWAFLIGIAVGPAIIHGQLGPQGNTVGVWWLQPNWDMAWLLVTAGSLILAKVLNTSGDGIATRSHYIYALVSGVLLGLGFFAHPAIILLIVPIVSLVLMRSKRNLRLYAVSVLGAGFGVAPAAASYVVNSGVNTWDPSHGAFISLSYYWDMGGAVLGLNGIPDYMLALLPYGIGLAPSHTFMSGSVQSIVMLIFILTILIVSIVGVAKSIGSKHWIGGATALALAWIVAILTMFGFITFVDPVWIYSSGLAILFWISLGALPSLFNKKLVGVTVTCVVIAVSAISTLSHNSTYLTTISSSITMKQAASQERKQLADSLVKAGATYIFGSYYDVIPVGYASSLNLRTITNHYNRFPLTNLELEQKEILVATNVAPTDAWGKEALATIQNNCTLNGIQEFRARSGSDTPGSYKVFKCSPSTISQRA